VQKKNSKKRVQKKNRKKRRKKNQKEMLLITLSIISVILIIIIFYVLYRRKKMQPVEQKIELKKEIAVKTPDPEPPSLLTVQKPIVPDILLNIWMFYKKNMFLIYYKIEKQNGEYFLTNSFFPGSTKIELQGNNIVQSDMNKNSANYVFGVLEGNKIIIQNPEKDEIVIAIEADYNIPVLYYGEWQENGKSFWIKPNERKKNALLVTNGPNIIGADVNGYNITLLGKTGKLEDMKIKWSDGTVWDKIV
jgi:hypothetical protein